MKACRNASILILVWLQLAACGQTSTTAAAPSGSPATAASASPTRVVPTLAMPSPAPSQTTEPSARAPTPEAAVAVVFTSIRMFDTTTGWASGQFDGTHLALRTTDGGVTWRDVSPADCRAFPLASGSASLAWVDDTPGCLTSDGGQTWTAVQPSGQYLWFNDERRGWSLGAEAWGLSFRQFDIFSLATTDDGGASWAETNPPPGSGVAYLAYPDADTAWALRAWFAKSVEGMPNLGVPISVHTTIDRGRTWTTRQLPLPSAAEIVDWGMGAFLGGLGNCELVSPLWSSASVWKFALTCEEDSWIYTSANQGKTWIISPMPAGVDAVVEFTSPVLGWLHVADWDSDDGHLYRTTDGGQSWALIQRTGWLDVVLSFVDAHTGWAVACRGPCYSADASAVLVRTDDGGLTWETIEPQRIP